MTTNTIQTHKLIERLVATGLSKTQSTEIVDSVIETQQELATKHDLRATRLDLEIALQKQTNTMLMSMIGIAGVAVAIIKLF